MKPENKNKNKKIFYIIPIVIIIIIAILCLVSCNRKYSVTMYANGQKLQASVVQRNEKVHLPKAPKKKGYTFAGWYVDGKEFDEDTLITKDLKLEAKYIKNEYTITFDSGNGNLNKIDVKYEGQVNAPSNPTKENYVFSGWYLGSDKFDFNTKITSDLTLTAKWTRIVASYRVEHFLMSKDGNYSNNPNEVETLKANAGSTVSPKTKVYKGYTAPSVKKVTINSNGSTVVKYYYSINKYTLTVIGDKGVEKALGSGSYFYNDEVAISYTLKPGYSFDGYSEDVNNNVYVMPDKDITIKVNAKANKDTKYIVKHYKMNIDGMTYADPIVEEKTGTTDAKVTPKVNDYEGFTSPDRKTVNINGDGSTVVEYRYERNKYDLIIEADQGIKEVTGSGKYYFEQEVNIGVSVKDGYTFDKYSKEVKDGIYKMPSSDVIIKAITTLNKYNITYDLNGGLLDNKVEEYNVETKDFALGEPTKTGYTFTGWKVNGNDSDGIIKKGTFGDLKVEATFKANDDTKYKVEYYYMDKEGNYPEKASKTLIKEGTSDSKIDFVPEEKEGFKTAVLKDNEGNAIEEKVNLNADGSTVLKYYYERNKYTLTVSYINTLDENDKAGVKKITETSSYYYEEEVSVSIELEEGFDFIKWSNDDTNINTTYKITSSDKQELIASIKRHLYNVTFDSKSGSKVDSKPTLFGKLIEKPNDPTRAGHDFDAWYYKDNDVEKKWDFEKNTMPASDVNLYAKWIIHKNTVSFDANGGMFKDEQTHHDVPGQTPNSKINEPEEEPVKPGYTFAGWYKDQDCTKDNKWDFEKDKMPDEALNLFAKWTANTYTLTYEGNTNTSGQMNIKTTCTYDTDCKLEQNKFKKEYAVTYKNGYEDKNVAEQTVKYIFVGWTYEGSENILTDEQIVNNLTTENKKEIKLAAKWEIDNETTALEPSLTRTGYEFAGWYDDSTNVDSLNDISKDLELTAHWTANTYEVEYNSNGGEGTMENSTYTYDKEENLKDNEFTKTGYHFKGWSKSSSSSDIIEDNKNYTDSGTITVYAVWEANKYTVTYDGGSKTAGTMAKTICTYDQDCELTKNAFEKEYTIIYDKNDNTKESSDSQSLKYIFKDWKNGENTYSDGVNVQNLTSVENGNVTLTAEWEVDTDTTGLKEVDRTGYTFAGWYKDEKNRLDNLNTVEEDLNLTAHWTPITYTIIFDGNGGTKDGKNKIEIIATYDDLETKALEAFDKSYNLIYDYYSDDDKVDKTVSEKVIFNNWKLDDKTTYTAGQKLGNLASTQDAKVTLTAQYTNPTVKITEENPTKNNTSSDKYYTYEFKDWSDGEKTYKRDGSITLTKETTLTAEYLKVINTDEYIKEKLITNDNISVTPSVSSSDNHSYNIDIVNVNDPIVNDKDIEKIVSILTNEDVKDVKLSSDGKSVTISDSSSVRSKTDEFLAKVTNTTTDKVESEKHLSSLFMRSLSVTVDFYEELAKTIDDKTSVTYNLTYTNSNKHIITQEELYSMSLKGINSINSAANKHFKIERLGNNISVKYNSRDEGINIMCIFAKSKSAMGITLNFCDNNDLENSYKYSGQTGMNTSIQTFFKDERISQVYIQNSAKNMNETINSEEATAMGNDTTKLAEFASSLVKLLDIKSDYKAKNSSERLAMLIYPDVMSLKGVNPGMLINKSFYIRVDLTDGYVYADGVNSEYFISVVGTFNS